MCLQAVGGLTESINWHKKKEIEKKTLKENNYKSINQQYSPFYMYVCLFAYLLTSKKEIDRKLLATHFNQWKNSKWNR